MTLWPNFCWLRIILFRECIFWTMKEYGVRGVHNEKLASFQLSEKLKHAYATAQNFVEWHIKYSVLCLVPQFFLVRSAVFQFACYYSYLSRVDFSDICSACSFKLLVWMKLLNISFSIYTFCSKLSWNHLMVDLQYSHFNLRFLIISNGSK